MRTHPGCQQRSPSSIKTTTHRWKMWPRIGNWRKLTVAKRSVRGSRVALTGASSGIGRALALELARHAAKMVLVARRGPLLERLAVEIEGAGGQASVVVGDITQPAVRHAAVARAEAVFGGLDIVINNAGVSAHGPFVTASSERLTRIMEVNFTAAVELIRTALPLLRRGNRPIVVNIGSILCHRGIPLNCEYCASKFALRGFSEALRAELATVGVDVLIVSPGSTETELFDHLLEQHGRPPWPSQRRAAPERVARATVMAIVRGRHEIVPSWRGRLLVWLNRLAPWLVDRLMAHYGQ
jgi:short-subunit dehydrogenase